MSGDARGGGRTRPFKVAAEPELVEALRAKKVLYQERADAWWSARRRAVVALPRAVQRRAAREELAALGVSLRRRGLLLDTAGAIMTHHVGVELAVRGWDREWDPVVGGAGVVPGRRYGSVQNGGPRWSGRLQVRLAEEVAERVVRATYWVSAEATAGLLGLADARAEGVVSPVEYGRRYAELAGRVVTTGQVLRAALIRATREFFPSTEGVPVSTEPRLWEEVG